MSYTSIAYSILVIVAFIVYYLFPKKYRWTILLAASLFFYIYNSLGYSLFILFTIASIYISTTLIDSINRNTKVKVKENKETWTKDERKAFKKAQEKRTKTILVITLLLNFGILFLLKYFGALTGKSLGLLLPLGISFYTFQSTGYLIDVYRENAEAEKNPFKLTLFVCFFPQIIQGPISEFSKLHDQLITPHDLKWENFKKGIETIIWGLFKKLFVADRAVMVVNAFLENGGTEKYPHQGPYGGTATLFVALIFAIQIYADFSGGIDISKGVAKLFGIEIAPNFRQPYFATSLTDYWRRWHITLGAWMRKYVFYPLATSGPFLKMNKKVNMGLASFLVFLLVGIWHGSNSKYLAFGIWNGAIIMLSIFLEPYFIKMRDALHIKATSFGHRLFQMVRTFILVLIGYYFDFSRTLGEAMELLGRTLTNQDLGVFMKEWRSLGFRTLEYLTLLFGVLVMFYFSVRLEQKGLETPADLLEERNGIIQWLFIFLGILLIVFLGIYGPGYDASEFVYMQF